MNRILQKTHFFQKEINKSIMATDVFIGVVSNDSENNVYKDIEECFNQFREFEQNFSRFLESNQLTKFNESVGEFTVSEDMFKMLELARRYHSITSGLFDISIYSELVRQGYAVSSKEGFVSPGKDVPKNTLGVDNLVLNKITHKVKKPEGIIVELGGLGKGYIVDKVSRFLSSKYRNFVVDAGGDIYYSGADLVRGYEYWACEIENPLDVSLDLPLLVLKNKGVATSSVDKRKWQLDGKIKNHIINPLTRESLQSKLVSCTVVADTTVEADIFAKSLLLMGETKGIEFANDRNIATLIVDNESRIYKSLEMDKYVFKD